MSKEKGKKLKGNGLFESSRMMLPEHREAILKQRKDIFIKPRPVLDEQRLEQLSRMIAEAAERRLEVTIYVYDPYGDQKQTGIISKIDTHFKRLRMQGSEEDDDVWIALADIVSITSNADSE